MNRTISAGRQLENRVYGFEELQVGDQFATESIIVTADHIDRFAGLTGDVFEIHMTDSGAQKHGFPGRVAHGLLILSLVDGLKNRADATFRAIASLGWNWSFHRPVFADDQIRATITIAEKRKTRHQAKAILRLNFEVTNQNGDVVQSGHNQLMIYC